MMDQNQTPSPPINLAASTDITLKRFGNLVGKNEQDTTRKILEELNLADVPVFALPNHFHPEVHSRCIGVLEFKKGPRLILERESCYWSIRATSALPIDIAREINDDFGDTVRLNGHCKGKVFGKTVLDRDDFEAKSWHVDNPRGLLVLIQAYRDQIGEHVARPQLSKSFMNEKFRQQL